DARLARRRRAARDGHPAAPGRARRHLPAARAARRPRQPGIDGHAAQRPDPGRAPPVRRALFLVVLVPFLGGCALPTLRPRVVAPGLPPRLPRALPRRRLRVPILMYHRVDRVVSGIPGLTVSPSAFAAEMGWLHATGFHAIT